MRPRGRECHLDVRVVALLLVSCNSDFADSEASYPGWALEADRAQAPLDAGVFDLVVEGRAVNPCGDCALDHEGQLTVIARVDEVGDGVDLRLSLGEESSERRLMRGVL